MMAPIIVFTMAVTRVTSAALFTCGAQMAVYTIAVAARTTTKQTVSAKIRKIRSTVGRSLSLLTL